MEVLPRPRVAPFPAMAARVRAPGEEVIPGLPARVPPETAAREARDDEGP